MKNTKLLKAICMIAALVMCLVIVTGCNSKKPTDLTSSSIQDSSSDADGNTDSSNDSTDSSDATDSSSDGNGASSGTPSNSGNGSSSATTNDKIVSLKGQTFVIGSGFFNDLLDPATAELIEIIEEKFGCKVKINYFWPSLSAMQKKIASGDKVADIVDMPADLMYQSAMAGYLKPMNTLSGINVNDSRWISGAKNLATFKGNTWGVNCWYPPSARTAIIYNRDLLKKNNITQNMESLVKSGGWTFAKLKEYAKATTKDTDGNGEIDTYGFGFADSGYAAINFMAANNGGLAKVASNKVSEAFSSQNSIEAINFYNDLVNVDKVVKLTAEGKPADMDQLFVDGKLAFYLCESWKAVQVVKPKADKLDYGILPMPKGPKASDYVTSAENYPEFFCITSTNKEPEKAVSVLNYIAKYYASAGQGDWWLEDVVAKDYFKAGDKASLEMYKLIVDKSAIDVGFIVDSLRQGFYTEVVEKSIFQKQITPSAAIDKIKGLYQKELDSVFNK
ncbi:MAG: hypothetical protein E7480_07260 [Ruminococcaceae bacterium]|nr:hypothetical protein [Oscillospiraceae bacterium]